MKATLWMVGALISFSIIGISDRELSSSIPVFKTLFFRSLIGLSILIPALRSMVRRSQFSTRRLKLHVVRNLFQFGWFWEIGLLSMSEVFAFAFTVPVRTAVIASVFLTETIQANHFQGHFRYVLDPCSVTACGELFWFQPL